MAQPAQDASVGGIAFVTLAVMPWGKAPFARNHTGDVEVYFCPLCGQPVVDRTIHVAWHEHLAIMLASGLRERNTELLEKCVWCPYCEEYGTPQHFIAHNGRMKGAVSTEANSVRSDDVPR